VLSYFVKVYNEKFSNTAYICPDSFLETCFTYRLQVWTVTLLYVTVIVACFRDFAKFTLQRYVQVRYGECLYFSAFQ